MEFFCKSPDVLLSADSVRGVEEEDQLPLAPEIQQHALGLEAHTQPTCGYEATCDPHARVSVMSADFRDNTRRISFPAVITHRPDLPSSSGPRVAGDHRGGSVYARGFWSNSYFLPGRQN